MKKYRITYNPYTRETRIAEHYDGCFPEWDELGGEGEWELNNILSTKNIIQKTGLDILSWIEKHNDMTPNGSAYEIDFSGIKQDFADMKIICDEFKRQFPDTKLQCINHTSFWDDPVLIQGELEKACRDIQALYEEDNYAELKRNLDSCTQISQTELNVLVLGVQNSGKSTLINALLGMDLLPVSSDVETAVLFTIKKSDRDVIKVITNEGEEAEIRFEGKKIEYDRSIIWLDRILDNIGYSENLKDAKSKTERMKYVLEGLNDACKNNNDLMIAFREVIVGISDFRIGHSAENFCIRDFPGAGAKYLGEEHKKIIYDEITNVVNAVTLYVLKSDDVSLENVQNFLTDLNGVNENNEQGLNGQIDFERSIYVLNKADKDKGKINSTNVINREFGGKKVVLTSAEAALQLQIYSETDPDFWVLFVEPLRQGKALVDLQERAILPVVYTRDYITGLVNKAVSGSDNPEAMKRTGVPLVASLLDEYAQNFAAIHKVSCYNAAVEQMLDALKKEEQLYKDNVQREKDNRVTRQDRIRSELRDNCDRACDAAVEKLTPDMVKNDLTKKLSGMLSGINDSVPNMIKSYRADKEIRKEWKDRVSEEINAEIEGKIDEICKMVNEIMKQYVQVFKESLLGGIHADNVEEEELWETQGLIRGYMPSKELMDNFKIPEKFSIDAVKDLWNKVFRRTKWYIDHTQKEITMYWGKTVVKCYADPLLENTKKSYKELNALVQRELDDFSPELKDLKKVIEDRERKLEELQKNREQSDKIRVRCKKIIETGRSMNL